MSATATAPMPAMPNGSDFADWLSPILVKELRQGLKSRAFVATFIIVQVVMILLVGLQLLTVAGGGGRGASDAFDGFFWAFVWLPLLVMMPARALTAVSEEVKANTLDLVQLTRLTAFRIVLGKWVALVSQTLLLVAAILPYAVLRYFFGQVDVVGDLTSITVLLMCSLLLTAGAIALSSLHLAVRVVVLVILLPTLLTGIIPMLIMRAIGGSSSFATFFEWSWMPPIFAAVYIYLLLEIAASRIAPVAENHAAPKRLVALGLGLGGVLMAWFAEEDRVGIWMALSSLACGWVILEALCERTVRVPSLYAPFARRGVLGRLAGRLLYPGWASGLVFSAVLVGIVATVVGVMSATHQPQAWEENRRMLAIVFPVLFAGLVSPLVVLQIFPRVKQPLWLYILVQALCMLLYAVAVIAAETPKLQPVDTYRWLAPVPTSTLLALFDQGQNPVLQRFFSMVTLPICALIICYLGFRAFKEFQVISQLERASLGGQPQSQD